MITSSLNQWIGKCVRFWQTGQVDNSCEYYLLEGFNSQGIILRDWDEETRDHRGSGTWFFPWHSVSQLAYYDSEQD